MAPLRRKFTTINQPPIRCTKRSDYRHHTDEFKRAVVTRSLTSGASVSLIAREHNINANQVFAWRKAFKEGKLGPSASVDFKLLPVTIAELPIPKPKQSPEMTATSAGVIQLEVGKVSLRIEGVADASTLSLIMERLLR
jgi:transposase